MTQAETLSACGFMTMEPDQDAWIASQRDKRGKPLLDCILDAITLSCGPSEAD
jgi:hypothetical protein